MRMALNIAAMAHFLDAEMVPRNYNLKISNAPSSRLIKNFKIRLRRRIV